MSEMAPLDEALAAALRQTYLDVFHENDVQLVLDFLGERGFTVAPTEWLRDRAQVRVAATEVVRLGNQPGMDDDEWETAMSNLEVALFPTIGALNDALQRVEEITPRSIDRAAFGLPPR